MGCSKALYRTPTSCLQPRTSIERRERLPTIYGLQRHLHIRRPIGTCFHKRWSSRPTDPSDPTPRAAPRYTLDLMLGGILCSFDLGKIPVQQTRTPPMVPRLENGTVSSGLMVFSFLTSFIQFASISPNDGEHRKGPSIDSGSLTCVASDFARRQNE